MTKEELKKLKVYYDRNGLSESKVINSHLECLAKVERLGEVVKLFKERFPKFCWEIKQALAELGEKKEK